MATAAPAGTPSTSPRKPSPNTPATSPAPQPIARLRASSPKVPQLRDTKRPFQSKIVDAYVARTGSLEDLVARMYVHGLSTRDIETIMQDLLQGRGISRSQVSQLTERLAEDFEKFRRQDLSGSRYWYLFLDGTFVKYRIESEQKEPVLACYGIREDGKKVLLGIAPGSRESKTAWASFLQDLRQRGLRAPVVVVSDGNPGVMAAIEEVWPFVLRQRCQKHRMENVLDRVPKQYHEEVKSAIYTAFYHEGDYDDGLAAAKKVIEKYQKKFPEAMRILEEDMEACLQVLKLPSKHRRPVRTTNLLERLFGENRRRTKVIPHFFQEGAAMKLIYATLVAASKKWRGIEVTTEDFSALSELPGEDPAEGGVQDRGQAEGDGLDGGHGGASDERERRNPPMLEIVPGQQSVSWGKCGRVFRGVGSVIDPRQTSW